MTEQEKYDMTAPNIRPFLGKDVVIVALGDSNTEYNHWSFGRNWVSMFACNARTAFSHATVINSGVSGDDVPRAMARLERDVLRFSPDIVIVSLGTNDAISQDIETFRANYRKLLTTLLEAGCAVVTRTATPAVDMKNGEEDLSDSPLRGAFMAEVVKISQELNCPCIDHYSLWKRSMRSRYRGEIVLLMGNYVHPNANGHLRLFKELAPYFGLDSDLQCEISHLLDRQDIIADKYL